MKTTKFSIGRILVVLMLVLVMAFSFTACNGADIDALEEADAELETALNDLKSITDAVNKKAALTEALASANKDELAKLTAQISELDAEINAAVKSLSDKVEALEKLVNGDATYAGLVADVEALKASVGTGVTGFVADFNAATEVLNKVNPDGSFGEKSLNRFNALKADFLALCESGFYTPDVATEFQLKVAAYEVRLHRAINVAQIDAVWAEFTALCEKLPNLSESFDMLLGDIGYLNLTSAVEAKMESLTTIYGMMTGDNAPTAEQTAAYEAITEAYDNLKDAKAWLAENYSPLVAAEKAKPFVLLGTDLQHQTIADKFEEFVNTFFGEDDYNKHYYALPETASDKDAAAEEFAIMIAGKDYADAVVMLQRLGDLNALNTAADKFTIKNYADLEQLPLYNNTEIPAEADRMDAWLKANALDVEIAAGEMYNVYTLLGEAEYKALVAMNAYVDAMYSHYTTYVLNNEEEIDLVADIDAIIAIETAKITLNGEKDAAADIRTALKALATAIEGTTNYNADRDGNYAAMIDATKEDKFEAVEARIKVLADAKTAFEALLAEMQGKYGTDTEALTVTFGDFAKIQEYKALYTKYTTETVENGGFALTDGTHYNYTATTEKPDDVGALAAKAYLDALDAEYDKISQIVREAYIAADKYLKDFDEAAPAFLLADGIGINAAYDALYTLIKDQEIADPSIDLNIVIEGETKAVNLMDLYNKFLKVVQAYTTYATAAETAGAAAYAQIMAVLAETFDASLLVNQAAVEDARAAFNNWATGNLANAGYLATLTNEDVAKLLKAIEGIKVFGSDPARNYNFITAENYNAFVEAEAANAATVEAAAEAVEAIEAALADFVTDGIADADKVTVLSGEDITAVYNLIDAYFVKFYGQEEGAVEVVFDAKDEICHLTVSLDVNGTDVTAYVYGIHQLEAGSNFMSNYAAVYAAYATKVAALEAAAGEIMSSIAGLPAADSTNMPTNFQAIVEATPAIVEALNAFYAEFYNGEVVNDAFGEDGDAYILAFHKTDAKADLYAYANTKVAETSNTAALDAQVLVGVDLINDVEAVADIEAKLTQAKGLIDSVVAANPVA